MPDLVLTLIGPDRPGLVESLAQPIADHGGNWLDSRMARLGGKFAGILQIEVPAEKLSALVQALRALEGRGLHVVVEESPATPAEEARHLVHLELEGLDRPGIVREISQVLAAERINIEELITERSSAPMSGEPLFRALARLDVPAGCDVARLRQRLERLATDLMVHIELDESAEG